MDPSGLRGIQLFNGLSDAELGALADRFEEIELISDSHIVEQGEFGYRFFAVLSGEVVVRIDGDEVARLGAGDFFGEMALLETERRTAEVVTQGRTRLASLIAWHFHDLTEQHPLIADQVRAAIDIRMGRT